MTIWKYDLCKTSTIENKQDILYIVFQKHSNIASSVSISFVCDEDRMPGYFTSWSLHIVSLFWLRDPLQLNLHALFALISAKIKLPVFCSTFFSLHSWDTSNWEEETSSIKMSKWLKNLTSKNNYSEQELKRPGLRTLILIVVMWINFKFKFKLKGMISKTNWLKNLK